MTIRIAPSRGFRISFHDVGRGDPVVLVPGSMMRAEDWFEAGYVDRLAGSYRVLVVDPLGHGASDKPTDPEAYRGTDVAADLVAVLDEAAVGGAALWGYSRGAWLAARAAADQPERVTSLVLGGQPLTIPPSPDPPWLDPLSRGDWDAFWPVFIPLPDESRRQFEATNDPVALAAVFRGARLPGGEVDLSRVRAPAIVYCGGGDGPELLEPTAAALGVELHRVGDHDHGGTFEAVDAVVPIVLEHLASSRAGQPR